MQHRLLTLFAFLGFCADSYSQTTRIPASFPRREHVVYYEDFERYPLGRMPSGWLFTDGHEAGRNPLHTDLVAKAEFSSFHGSKALVCLQGNPAYFSPAGENILGRYRTNLAIEFEFYLERSQGVGQSAGILLGKAGSENSTDQLSLSFFREHLIVHCSAKQYFMRRLPIPPIQANGWHHVGLRYEWDELKIYLDHQHLATIPACVHPASFWLCGADVFAFRKVIITHDDPALQPFGTDATALMNIHFDVDKAEVKPYDTSVLLGIASWLKIHGDHRITLMGHADRDGDSSYNLSLSLRRAEAVKRELVGLGLEAHRVEVEGYGYSKPVDLSNTEHGKALNRRVMFVVRKY